MKVRAQEQRRALPVPTPRGPSLSLSLSLSLFHAADQRTELLATLNKYNPLLVLVGHTHSAELYSFNGTAQGQWASGHPDFVDVVNAPATQKEDGKGNPLPSEFMVLEAAMDTLTATTGTLRVAQRVGSAWGAVQGKKSFDCRA